MKVREVAADEVEPLARLSVDAFESLPCARFEDGYLGELADVARRAREAVVLVAVDDDGGLLGGITYVDRSGPWARLDNEGDAEIRMLAVAPAARGRGVGGQLVDACIDRARASGKRRIVLHTTSWMEAAQRVYQRAGFCRSPEHDIELLPGLMLLGYVLHLDG